MYSQDAQIDITNTTAQSIFTADPVLDYGKFYKAPDKNVEVLLRDIDEQEIRTGGTFSLSACGRSWELSGTTGSVGLEDVDDNHIATFHWDVPLGSKTNTFEVQDIAANYRVTFNGYNRRGGHLGTVKVEVTRL